MRDLRTEPRIGHKCDQSRTKTELRVPRLQGGSAHTQMLIGDDQFKVPRGCMGGSFYELADEEITPTALKS
jgi:hypothetical protein